MDQRFETLGTLRRLREDPATKEAAILVEQGLAETDSEVRQFVERFYFDADREASFQRYLASDALKDVLDTIGRFAGKRRDISICEIGAGNGFLAASLVRAGYSEVDILEPAADWTTGTGYLRSIPEFQSINVFNDIDAWYGSTKLYDLIITNACIHHFENPAFAAAQIRLKVNDAAVWLAFTEFVAVDYEDVLSQLNNHRHAMLYGLYEWPYSVDDYARMLGRAGFDLREIAPIAAYGKRALPFRREAFRAVWRYLCLWKVSRPLYRASVALLAVLGRRRLRHADPAFMAFSARPIRWSSVQSGFSSEVSNSLRFQPQVGKV